jgi:hypothetical protein
VRLARTTQSQKGDRWALVEGQQGEPKTKSWLRHLREEVEMGLSFLSIACWLVCWLKVAR